MLTRLTSEAPALGCANGYCAEAVVQMCYIYTSVVKIVIMTHIHIWSMERDGMAILPCKGRRRRKKIYSHLLRALYPWINMSSVPLRGGECEGVWAAFRGR